MDGCLLLSQKGKRQKACPGWVAAEKGEEGVALRVASV